MSQPVSPPNPVQQFYDDWCARTPYVTRRSTIGIVLVYLMSFIFAADYYFGNTTSQTIMSLQLYRIFLSPIVGNSIVDVIIVLLIYPAMGTKLEYSMGSSSFILLLGFLTFSINILFNVICLGFYSAGILMALIWKCSGFWTILFALITIECLQVIVTFFKQFSQS